MTPDPTPQHDHGAAGFCTNHAQPPDERTETVAGVLRKHEWDGGETLNLGYYRTEATCICGITYWGGDHDEDPSLADALIAHKAAAVVAALDDETARLRASADAWWSEYDRELQAHEATKAEVERLSRIVNGYDRTPAEQRAADAEAERDALRAECRDTWRMFEAAEAQRDEARKAGAGFWPALAGQNDRDAWTFMAERDAARAALDRVRALHRPVWDGARGDHRCSACSADLTAATPDCPTVAALDPEEPR